MSKKSKTSVGPKRAGASRAAKGEVLRRRVLGDAHVDKSIAGADLLSADFTQLIHEWVWHDIWGRPGLPLKTRSLINIGLLAALNRPRELKIHLRGAVNNGCTLAEIREVLMHTSLYAGVPAALDGLQVARETLSELGVLPRAKPKSAPKRRSKRSRKGT
ncbi:MAG: carboxymuconolactone decarboxylase family protein [Rhodobacteraceae bacterium]|nr:carboxymuconolactone decarboxylase family protein [Paracoccaceae bacterium]